MDTEELRADLKKSFGIRYLKRDSLEWAQINRPYVDSRRDSYDEGNNHFSYEVYESNEYRIYFFIAHINGRVEDYKGYTPKFFTERLTVANLTDDEIYSETLKEGWEKSSWKSIYNEDPEEGYYDESVRSSELLEEV